MPIFFLSLPSFFWKFHDLLLSYPPPFNPLIKKSSTVESKNLSTIGLITGCIGITLFDASVSRETIIAAAKKIGVDEFINSLPGNYDYVVGERGVTLSAGQRQLIAFLRVYIRDPKILILDEATASIDTATEELLQSALEKLSTNRTTIVIAHRLSTIVNADKILHLKNGNVLEEGTHQELLKFKDAYSKMFSKQSDANLNA